MTGTATGRRGFARWLRQSSEHYLLVDAQRRMAAKYGRPVASPHGVRDRFWLGGFAPVYRLLPWTLRRLAIQAMPGSHRQSWHNPATRGVPAVGPLMSQPVPETRGE